MRIRQNTYIKNEISIDWNTKFKPKRQQIYCDLIINTDILTYSLFELMDIKSTGIDDYVGIARNRP